MSNGAWSPWDPEQEGPTERKDTEGRKWVLTSQFCAWIQGVGIGERGRGPGC